MNKYERRPNEYNFGYTNYTPSIFVTNEQKTVPEVLVHSQNDSHELNDEYVECYECSGSGDLEEDCPDCNGDGEVECDSCGSMVECDTCFGDFVRNIECYNCDGTGQILSQF